MWHLCGTHTCIPAKHSYTLNKINKYKQEKERTRIQKGSRQTDKEDNGLGINRRLWQLMNAWKGKGREAEEQGRRQHCWADIRGKQGLPHALLLLWSSLLSTECTAAPTPHSATSVPFCQKRSWCFYLGFLVPSTVPVRSLRGKTWPPDVFTKTAPLLFFTFFTDVHKVGLYKDNFFQVWHVFWSHHRAGPVSRFSKAKATWALGPFVGGWLAEKKDPEGNFWVHSERYHPKQVLEKKSWRSKHLLNGWCGSLVTMLRDLEGEAQSGVQMYVTT